MRNLAEETILLPIDVKKVYSLLSKLKNFSKLLSAHTSDWEFDGDVCSFIYDNSTPTKLKMYESIKNEKVVIGTYGSNSIEFDMEFLMFDVDKKRTNFKMVIKADLNPIMASMVTSSMEELMKDFVCAMKKDLGLPNKKKQKKQS